MADDLGAERLDIQEEEEGGPVKSFLEHLEDLRWVLIKSLATIGVAMVVCFFGGNYVFKFFGITVPAFQIMGGVLFLTNALRSLISDDRRGFNAGGEKRIEDSDVEKADMDPSSIAIVPIAVPMLSGPGAITSVMVLVNLYPEIEQRLAVIVAIVAVGAISSYDDVNSILLAGRADLCAIGRPHLYDPAWTLHSAAEQEYDGAGVTWPIQYRSGARRPQTGRRDLGVEPSPFETPVPAVRPQRWRPQETPRP